MSLARQNYHPECEAIINKLINIKLYSSYVYQSMAYYFDRDDVALPGFYKYFKKSSDEEREHAEKFMTYQNKRGGRIVLKPIERPDKDEWGSGANSMQVALALKKNFNQSLLELHRLSASLGDNNLCDFLEGNFLSEQVDSIKEISDYITNLKRTGGGLGEFMFDKEMLGGNS